MIITFYFVSCVRQVGKKEQWLHFDPERMIRKQVRQRSGAAVLIGERKHLWFSRQEHKFEKLLRPLY